MDIWYDVDTALAEVPVNLLPLVDDTDFKTREVAVAYDAAGMDLVWNFVTTAGAATQTAVTPTTGGAYDWAHLGDGIYTIEIPASGGASINNDTEGFGWFSGVATGVLPWRGPVIGFRAAALNDALVDGGDTLDVNVTAMAAGTVTATAIATGAIDADAVAADAVTELQSGLATAAALATVDGVVDTILADTGELQTNQGAWATATGFAVAGDEMDLVDAPNATAVTAIQSGLAATGEATTAVGTLNDLSQADVRTAVGMAGADLDTQLDAIVADTGELQTNQGAWATATGFATHSAADVWAVGTRTLTSFGTLVADIWAAATSGLTTVGSVGKKLADWVVGKVTAVGSTAVTTSADVKADVSGLATSTALATVDSIVDTILVDTNELQTNQGNWLTATGFSTHSAADVWAAVTRTLTANTNLNDPTAATVADAVLDELLSGHAIAGSAGKAISDILLDTAEIGAAGAGLTEAGGTGDQLTALGDTRLANLDATVSSRLATTGYTAPLDAAGTRTALGMVAADLDTQLDALPTDADVQAAAAAALTAYDPPTAAEVTAAVQALLTTDLAGYEATGKTGTRMADMLCLIRAAVAGRIALTNSTLTVYEADGTTAMATYTIGAGYNTRSTPA